ncbi:uncharacterized protein B0I36DRAFT_346572 [Microdochium trichocladiopsis]|uniref:Uncharacterized protein n=1 Tax=Microdochium trichocladiopsis TaxID=1682393 RepID=A0A9P8YCS1_9PEZI|nr:uncharacterized protein B0I36DRAFT_346572 [Microdochium trichocladiopsis]KAH7034668.1 hypothetical protein B0I36DRAFT_346572 [Microdochium trichocladiopsis]
MGFLEDCGRCKICSALLLGSSLAGFVLDRGLIHTYIMVTSSPSAASGTRPACRVHTGSASTGVKEQSRTHVELEGPSLEKKAFGIISNPQSRVVFVMYMDRHNLALSSKVSRNAGAGGLQPPGSSRN